MQHFPSTSMSVFSFLGISLTNKARESSVRVSRVFCIVTQYFHLPTRTRWPWGRGGRPPSGNDPQRSVWHFPQIEGYSLPTSLHASSSAKPLFSVTQLIRVSQENPPALESKTSLVQDMQPNISPPHLLHLHHHHID